jgi:hypothetical protein
MKVLTDEEVDAAIKGLEAALRENLWSDAKNACYVALIALRAEDHDLDGKLLESRVRCAAAAESWFDDQIRSSGIEDNPIFQQLRKKQRATLRAAILEAIV